MAGALRERHHQIDRVFAAAADDAPRAIGERDRAPSFVEDVERSRGRAGGERRGAIQLLVVAELASPATSVIAKCASDRLRRSQRVSRDRLPGGTTPTRKNVSSKP